MTGARTWRPGEHPWLPTELDRGARCRVIVDNDFAGDPDDLWQLAHHLLSPSVEVSLVVSSRLELPAGLPPVPDAAARGAARVREMFAVMRLDADDVLVAGSEAPLAPGGAVGGSAAARRIVAEALRDDPRPLFLACGGGLTEAASALLLEPRVAERLTVVWIGGPERPGSPRSWSSTDPEFNWSIDPVAARVVLEDSGVPLWQVPRDVYRQCLASDAELHARVALLGPFGRYLWDQLQRVRQELAFLGVDRAETYVLGDSPLVLLTALQSALDSDASSSSYEELLAPAIADDGSVAGEVDGRMVRVYRSIDTRLMLEDMYAKFAAFSAWLGT